MVSSMLPIFSKKKRSTSSNSLLMWTLIGSKKKLTLHYSLQLPADSRLWRPSGSRPPVSAMARSAASKASWYFSPRSAAWKNGGVGSRSLARPGKYIKLRYTEVVNIPFFMKGIYHKTIYWHMSYVIQGGLMAFSSRVPVTIMYNIVQSIINQSSSGGRERINLPKLLRKRAFKNWQPQTWKKVEAMIQLMAWHHVKSSTSQTQNHWSCWDFDTSTTHICIHKCKWI